MFSSISNGMTDRRLPLGWRMLISNSAVRGEVLAAPWQHSMARASFTLADGKLLNITPENFSKLIVVAKDAGGLKAAFDGLHSGDGIKLGAVSGSVNIANGVAVFSPFGTTSPDATVLVKPIAELADGKIDIGVVLSLKALPELPPMEISYSGTPSQLVAGEDRTALTSYLGFKVLEKGVDELEKVQTEQERLAIEEEELRKEDRGALNGILCTEGGTAPAPARTESSERPAGSWTSNLRRPKKFG